MQKQVGAAPTNVADAVTKGYVEGLFGGSAVLTADVAGSAANTMANITGLSFSVVAGGSYYFKFIISFTAAVTTTGSRWSINGPAITALRYRSEYSLTATTQTINEGLTAYDTPTTTNLSSAAVGANIATIEGFITPSAAGTVIARFTSEIAASAITAKAGSFVTFRKLM